jgi:cytochrome c peroxidase
MRIIYCKSMKVIFGLIVILSCLVFITCQEQVVSPDDRISMLPLETLPEVRHPENNPASEEKRLLGKYLFYDPILSGEKDIACVTCHLPNLGYSDGIDLSIGVGGVGLGTDRADHSGGRIPINGRNSMTIINTAFNGIVSSHQSYDPLEAPMFWDGRRNSLETQSIGPPAGFNIMRGNAYGAAVTYDSIIKRLQRIPEYQLLFDEVFGGANSITTENIAKALAAFERSVISANSPYDRYVKGEKEALNKNQKLGLQLFFGKANCATCHSGPMFSDFSYYALGVPDNVKRSDTDKGAAGVYLFRTPSLRNAGLTAPYMHSGTMSTLEEVIHYYAAASSGNPEVKTIDTKVQPLELNEKEISNLVEFIHALTDDSYDQEFLTRVPSGLKPGGN